MAADQKPENGRPKTWTGPKVLAAIAALVTAVAAILAAMFAKGQIDAADQQKVASQTDTAACPGGRHRAD